MDSILGREVREVRLCVDSYFIWSGVVVRGVILYVLRNVQLKVRSVSKCVVVLHDFEDLIFDKIGDQSTKNLTVLDSSFPFCRQTRDHTRCSLFLGLIWFKFVQS